MKYRQRILLKRDKSCIQEMKEEAENRKRESKKQRERKGTFCVCVYGGVCEREKTNKRSNKQMEKNNILCMFERERITQTKRRIEHI